MFHTRVNNRWRVERRLAVGGFGTVYLASDSNGTKAVLKVDRGRSIYLRKEIRVYRNVGNISALPKVYYSGLHETHRVLVLEYFKKNLFELQRECHGRLREGDVLKIGIQVLSRLQALHQSGYVHGDLHPGNIMIADYSRPRLYLIDLGSAVRYRTVFGLPLTMIVSRNVPCHMMFASADRHRGARPSRKDDLISLLYIMIYLQVGSLPWSQYCNQVHLQGLINVKQLISSEQLCGPDSPSLQLMCKRLRAMSSSSTPSYFKLREELRLALNKKPSLERTMFEWQT